MPHFPNSSGPHSFGGSNYHSYHGISLPQSSSFTGYSANQLHERHARTIRSPKAPNTSTRTPVLSPSATTPEVHIPKTNPSSANVPILPLFESMKADIKSYIVERKELDSLQYELSWEQFLAFREEAKKSVPGWEKLNVDYQINSRQLLIQCAGPGHEIMDDVFMHFWQTQRNDTGHLELLRNVITMGTAEMDLQDGAGKQPDFSFVDQSPSIVNEEERSFPTTIFEVGYTETSQKLAVDCGRFISCSLGRGLLAIAIDIQKHKGELSAVRFAKWELDSIEEIESWPPGETSPYFNRKVDTLYQSDGARTPTPATSFYCISRIGAGDKKKHYAFHAKEVDACLINSNDTNPSGLTILYRHMYREPEESQANDILYNIPYTLMMKIICKHEQVDTGRKTAVKRKNEPEAQEIFQEVIHKRQKMIDALTKLATGSKPRPKSKAGSSK